MGPVGRAIKSRQPQVMLVDAPDFEPWREEAKKRDFRMVCAFPILNGDEVRGVITLYSGDREAYGPPIYPLLEVFARQCSMVLVNASLYEEAQRTIHELWEANERLQGK